MAKYAASKSFRFCAKKAAHSSHERGGCRMYIVRRFMLPGMLRNKAEQAMAQRSRRPAMSHTSKVHNLIAQDCEVM